MLVLHPRTTFPSVVVMSDDLWLRSNGVDPESVSDEERPAAVQYAIDMQEANSRKYGNGIVILLPLNSGNFATFGIDRQDVKILSPDEVEAATIAKLVTHYSAGVAARTAHIHRLREVGADEPDARTLARDLKSANRPQARKRAPSGPAEDIDMDAL